MTPNRFGPILLAPPFSKVWHCRHGFDSAWPLDASALAMSGSIGSGPAGAPFSALPAAAAAPASAPGGRKTAFSNAFGRTIWLASMPVTIAIIIAVSTDAMTLFHSKDDIDASLLPSCRLDFGRPTRMPGPQKIGFCTPTQTNYDAFGA